jgi:hypothetical protein
MSFTQLIQEIAVSTLMAFGTDEPEWRTCQVTLTNGTDVVTQFVRAQVESCHELDVVPPNLTASGVCCWEVGGHTICMSTESVQACKEWVMALPCNPFCDYYGESDDCCSMDLEEL